MGNGFVLDDVCNAAKGGLELATVGDDTMPQVRNEGSILEMAKGFGRYAPKLDLFEMNGTLVYYDHRRERQEMTGRVFRGWVENYIYVVGGYDPKTGAPQSGSINLGNAMDVLVNPAFLRGVRRIKMEETVRLPRISKEGKLELMPEGYDDETGVYTVPGGLVYPVDWDVAQGKEWFKKWFGAMPYADDRSMAVMLVGLLVMYVRHLPGGNGLRPGILWEANMAGSGKSICAKAACSITLGFAPSSKRKKGEELDKEIEAHVRSKSAVIFLDNLYGSLKSATLDQLITSKVQTFRGMGGQAMVTLRNDSPVFATGNELEKNDDAWRRWLQCYLFEAGDPQERKIPFLLDEDVMESEAWRKEALAAMWSFVRYWDEKGRPAGKTTLGSFESFSMLLGGIVVACGFEDPIKRPEGEAGMNPEKLDFTLMVKGLYAEMVAEDLKVKAFGLDEMARVARSLDLFSDMIGDADFGKKQMILQEKLTGEERSFAVDQGHMTQSQLQHWTSFIKGKIGQEPVIDGVRVRFGDRIKEKRRVKFTLQVL